LYYLLIRVGLSYLTSEATEWEATEATLR
jgi:hypothetical protein